MTISEMRINEPLKFDALVERKVLNREPILSYEISSDGGKSTSIGFSTEIQAKKYLDDMHARGLLQEYAVVPMERPNMYEFLAHADYEILKHVREKWEIDKIFDMTCILREIWMKRQGSVGSTESFRLFYAYQPGDYAEAALRVVMGDEQ